jgi:hypothetical protein
MHTARLGYMIFFTVRPDARQFPVRDNRRIFTQ